MIKNNKYLKTIDLKNSDLLSYKKIILKNKVNLFINLKKKNIFKEYINFSKYFGPILEYKNKPYSVFPTISQEEIALHTDGVSCLKYDKIPKLIFFYIKKWPKNENGYFKVVSIKKLISKIPKNYIKILKEQKLQYLNYAKSWKSKHKKDLNNQINFQKKCLRKVNNHLVLDIFLPLKKNNKNLLWKHKEKFEHLSLKDSHKILSKIRSLAEEKDCCIKFPLSSNSIMVFDNERFLHGRDAFSKKNIKRTMFRIQVLN